MTEEKKPDCVLSDGREMYIDLTKTTIREWRDMLKPEQAEEMGDQVTAKVAGLTLDEFQNLNPLDWNLITRTMFDVWRNRNKNPTLPSA